MRQRPSRRSVHYLENMATKRSVCLLCRSYLLREQQSSIFHPSPPQLAHTTREILQFSQSARSVPACVSGGLGNGGDCDAIVTKPSNQNKASSHFSRETLQSLPTCRFTGEIVNIRSPEQEEKYYAVIGQLMQDHVLGFDVEGFQNSNKPIVVQLASRDLCILWQLNQMSHFPLLLHGILSSPHYLKVGHGSLADARALLNHYAVNCVNVFDTLEFLTSLPDHFRPPLLNLQGLVGLFLGQWLSKFMTRSNWGKSRLSWRQLVYASTDVWASLEVYLALMKYANDIEVIPPPSVECTLTMCKPLLVPSLEESLRENIEQAEKARRGVYKLISDCTDISSSSAPHGDSTSSTPLTPPHPHHQPQCALSSQSS